MASNNSPFHSLKIIYRNLPSRNKIQVLTLLLIMILGGFLEFLSVGLLFPLLQLLTGEINESNEGLYNSDPSYLNYFNQFEVGKLTTILLILVFSAGAIRLYINWKSGLIAASIGNRLAKDSFKSLLSKEYDNYLLIDTHKQISTVTIQVTRCVSAITSSLKLIASFIIGTFLSSSLLYLKPFLTIYSTIFFAIIYLIIIKFSRKRLTSFSFIISESNKFNLKYVKEALTGFREIKMNRSERFFLDRFKNNDLKLRTHTAYSNFYATFPRYAIETIMIAVIILFATLSLSSSLKIFIPTIGIFAFTTQKLLPLIQQIYGGWARLKNAQFDLQNVCSLIYKPKSANQEKTTFNFISINNNNKEFNFSNLKLINVDYRYPNTKSNVLNNINLTINQGEIIGIKGISGSGKTTMVDIMSGLLKPLNGDVLVNNKSIIGDINYLHRTNWSKFIAYVPQNIFLSDQSITNNIAFGIEDELIDIERVKKCLEMVQLNNISTQLNEAFHYKKIGDGGIRLSGGQRQRIGIARALYRKCDVLILDEGTSALDSFTEQNIIKTISNLPSNLTIIMVAHRLSTLNICNQIYTLENGNIQKN